MQYGHRQERFGEDSAPEEYHGADGAGFRGDTNKVTFIDAAGSEALPLLTKGEVAQRIADKIERLIQK